MHDKDVIMLSQKEQGTTTVRVAAELIEPIERLIENAKDEFGSPLFRSKTDFVTKAVKEFLRKQMPKMRKEA